MRRRLVRCALLELCAALVLFGCGSSPIPTIAVEGSTITIFVPQDFEPGFGRALSDTGGPGSYPHPTLPEDPQRGELEFTLVRDSDGAEWTMNLRLVTRVAVDEASRAATANYAFEVFGLPQALALLDVPTGVVPVADEEAPFRIVVKRRRRNESSPTTFDDLVTQTYLGGTIDWKGWGDFSPATGIPITIRKGNGSPTPTTGWFELAGIYGSYDANPDYDWTVPYAEFTVVVPIPGNGDPIPHAWDMEIEYPIDKVAIRGVSLSRHHPSSAVVLWRAEDAAGLPDDPDTQPACGAPAGTLKIHVADAAAWASGVKVAYNLRNFPDCGGRASAGDFQIPDFSAFDQTGSLLPSVSHEIFDDFF